MAEQMPASVDSSSLEKPATVADKYLSLRRERRENERDAWNAYWKFRDLDSQGTIYSRIQYWTWRFIDAPVTWWRETVVEPLHDKYKRPYYHRKYTRVPYIDECNVFDWVCFYEANMQYRLDKLIDTDILEILNRRRSDCSYRHQNDLSKCVKQMEDYEQAELNFFIKYGELGAITDVRHCYWKQKHRMVWERRHPEAMQQRMRLYQEHKEKMALGEYDLSFWKKGRHFADKTQYLEPYVMNRDKSSLIGDRPTSKDWQYYKQRAQDPEYDKEQKKKEKTGTQYAI